MAIWTAEQCILSGVCKDSKAREENRQRYTKNGFEDLKFSWRNYPETDYPGENQNNAKNPGEVHGLIKEQCTENSGANNPDSGPDCIACSYWQRLQGQG